MSHHMVKKRHAHRPKSTVKVVKTAPNKVKDRTEIWRVIAPFVTVPRKSTTKLFDEEDEKFSFYLKKKPAVLIKDLSSFMSDSVDLPSLFHETAEVLRKVTKSSWVTLYLVDRVSNEIFQSKSGAVKERHKVKWPINDASTVAAYVAKKKEYVLVEDVLFDQRFPEGVGYDHASKPKSVMCIPVVTPDGDVFAVIELVRTVDKKAFKQDELKICVMVTAWMGVAIHQNKERLALKRQQELNDYLLDLVRCYFEDHVLMEKLMSEVVKFAKITLGAERGSFFIIDPDSDEMIAHLFDETDESEGRGGKKVRFSRERGIAGLVARTGTTVNIKDAYKDSRFNKEIDQKTGFITRSILCMPILGAQGVLGVVQVVNKRNGGCFSNNDENLFKTFSLYCSMAVHYTNVHTQIEKQQHLNAIDLRTIKFQQVPCIHDVTKFDREPHVKMPPEFNHFTWYINNIDELEVAPQYILYMMYQMIHPSEINREIMMKFILTVRKFYRNVPYHNFEHAFNVCHCMYLILRRNRSLFSKLEIKALLVACLCHDLDHEGYTNNFLQLVKDDLAMLYETSILENHHFEVTMMLLQDHEIFNDFSAEVTKEFHHEIQVAILATDLAVYFDRKVSLLNIYKSNDFDWRNSEHRFYIKSIMMNCCDLSGNCKPFLAARRITDNLYREFYRQGDKEKELGVCPLSVMDRDQIAMIPNDQIRFLNVVVIPCFEILRIFLPNTQELLYGTIRLRETWQDIINTRGKKIWRQDDSLASAYL